MRKTNRDKEGGDNRDKKMVEEIRMGLLEKRILLIDGDVDEEMSESVLTRLDILRCDGSPPIEVELRTYGGCVFEGRHIYDALTRYAGEKTCVVTTKALSMGAIILQACDVRVGLPGSLFLIHDGSLSCKVDELLNTKKFAKLRKMLLLEQKAFDEIIALRTGKSVKQIHAACLKDEPMTAKEALEFGLIDKIEDKDQIEDEQQNAQ